MKINKQSDHLLKAFQDFLKANFPQVNGVAAKGKFILEITDSQIKGSYVSKDNAEKLKSISYKQT